MQRHLGNSTDVVRDRTGTDEMQRSNGERTDHVRPNEKRTIWGMTME